LSTGSWPVHQHLAARAAKTDADTVTVHLQLVQTPHKLCFTCDLRTGTFELDWRTTPLMRRWDSPLSALAHPDSVSPF